MRLYCMIGLRILDGLPAEGKYKEPCMKLHIAVTFHGS